MPGLETKGSYKEGVNPHNKRATIAASCKLYHLLPLVPVVIEETPEFLGLLGYIAGHSSRLHIQYYY
jgi:hypothetical protein